MVHNYGRVRLCRTPSNELSLSSDRRYCSKKLLSATGKSSTSPGRSSPEHLFPEFRTTALPRTSACAPPPPLKHAPIRTLSFNSCPPLLLSGAGIRGWANVRTPPQRNHAALQTCGQWWMKGSAAKMDLYACRRKGHLPSSRWTLATKRRGQLYIVPGKKPGHYILTHNNKWSKDFDERPHRRGAPLNCPFS